MSCNSQIASALKDFVQASLQNKNGVFWSVFEGANDTNVYVRLRMENGTKTLCLQDAQGLLKPDNAMQQEVTEWLACMLRCDGTPAEENCASSQAHHSTHA